ncbi:MAG: hypothetical protein MHM6MM_002495 [Cercozoa sp. M6MM]
MEEEWTNEKAEQTEQRKRAVRALQREHALEGHAPQHFRSFSLFQSLCKAANELRQEGYLPADDAFREALASNYDSVIEEELQKMAEESSHLVSVGKDAKLMTYRHVEDVWTFVLKDCELRSSDGDVIRAAELRVLTS